ncbi:MAG: hypothetical protein A3I75_07105 [Deltaproteobacteria bacterium RIFCSPLOWO2_02_FULL_50_16]|nr:MAG: hypothetical protein A2053_04775 [Deltaproteobacteria bacterium GWA2_50_8]OGQ56490.1 MAG: hypothetical protein A3I75_07105 [Deltaproteobacteria bacterium RIFCSPLOWO2_02_FULL_50_16]OGQ65754.1 MAG: hypothetical protein A3F89_05040 [Deltaproteobacteria bacterium RIFCSPLOWO2_12_FULL_50_11]
MSLLRGVALLLTIAISFVMPPPPGAGASESCLQWSRIYNRNLIRERNPTSGLKVLVLPFLNVPHRPEDDWIGEAFRILLGDYLSHIGKTWVFPNRLSTTTVDIHEAVAVGRQLDMDYVIIGSFSHQPPVLKIYATVVDANDKGGQVARYEGDVEYPVTAQLGLLFFNLASFISQAMKQGPLNEKKLAPFINNPRRTEALKAYIIGDLSLNQGTPEGVKDALNFFLKAIQGDYNYAPAYLKYAQALAIYGFINKLLGKDYRIYYERAERELMKAEALNPRLAEWKKTAILRFLHAEIYEVAAQDWLAQNKLGRAAKEYEKANDILPGNPNTHGNLASIYQKMGKTKSAENHYRELLELNRCMP